MSFQAYYYTTIVTGNRVGFGNEVITFNNIMDIILIRIRF